jgi:hypothetical protein
MALMEEEDRPGFNTAKDAGANFFRVAADRVQPAL